MLGSCLDCTEDWIHVPLSMTLLKFMKLLSDDLMMQVAYIRSYMVQYDNS